MRHTVAVPPTHIYASTLRRRDRTWRRGRRVPSRALVMRVTLVASGGAAAVLALAAERLAG